MFWLKRTEKEKGIKLTDWTERGGEGAMDIKK